MMEMLLAAALATSAPDGGSLNPRAAELFEGDAVLSAWALRRFDRNGDGWLTLYEAQPALAAFKEMADTNRDGRVSLDEYKTAKAFVAARDNLAESSTVVSAR